MLTSKQMLLKIKNWPKFFSFFQAFCVQCKSHCYRCLFKSNTQQNTVTSSRLWLIFLQLLSMVPQYLPDVKKPTALNNFITSFIKNNIVKYETAHRYLLVDCRLWVIITEQKQEKLLQYYFERCAVIIKGIRSQSFKTFFHSFA